MRMGLPADVAIARVRYSHYELTYDVPVFTCLSQANAWITARDGDGSRSVSFPEFVSAFVAASMVILQTI